MTRYVCQLCGYVHDEAGGNLFSSLPDAWTCPVCGAAKSMFEPESLAGVAEAAAEPVAGPGPIAASEPVAVSHVRAVGRRALRAHRFFGYVFLAV